VRSLRWLALVLLANTIAAQEKTLLTDPVKVVVGYEDGGIGATAKGEYVTAFGKPVAQWSPGATYGIDGAWNSKADKPDQVEFSAGAGLVEMNAGYPRWSGFLRMLGKNGQFEQDAKLEKVNQILAGVTIEYVPRLFSDWVSKKVTIPVDQFPADSPCLTLTAEERAKHPECKVKVTKTLQSPPHFTLSYYHPLRTRGDVALPEKIVAHKLTSTFEADNIIFENSKLPLRVVANLSATYHHELTGKIDAGVGLPLAGKFTPIVKYVSGEKDGFKYDKALIVGILLSLTD